MSDDQVRDAKVYIDPELHKQLKTLAESDRRTIGGEVEHLIEQEIIRRGLIHSIGHQGPSSKECEDQVAATGQD